jgi:hypothetical protein
MLMFLTTVIKIPRSKIKSKFGIVPGRFGKIRPIDSISSQFNNLMGKLTFFDFKSDQTGVIYHRINAVVGNFPIC